MEREQLRKRYMKNLLAFVEAAYEKDPRIAHFRDCDKQRKLDQKNWKRQEKQRLVEEREAQTRQRQAELDAEKQQAAEQAKLQVQEKQRVKEQMKISQQRLRDLAQEKQYFSDDSQNHLKVMEGVERVCMNATLDHLNSVIDQLQEVNELTEALDLLSLKVCVFIDATPTSCFRKLNPTANNRSTKRPIPCWPLQRQSFGIRYAF